MQPVLLVQASTAAGGLPYLEGGLPEAGAAAQECSGTGAAAGKQEGCHGTADWQRLGREHRADPDSHTTAQAHAHACTCAYTHFHALPASSHAVLAAA